MPEGHYRRSRGRCELVFQRGRLILGETEAARVGTWCCGGVPHAARVRPSNTHDNFGHVDTTQCRVPDDSSLLVEGRL